MVLLTLCCQVTYFDISIHNVDNPESVVEVVSSIIGDYIIQLFTEQS